MRWIVFILLAFACVMVQTTLAQIVWIPTPAGGIVPVLPACVAVFVALFARSGTDAALAGWALGLGVDLTLSGPGMGLLSLLFAAAGGVVFHLRQAFFPERAATQVLLGGLFYVLVFELWAVYMCLLGDFAPAGLKMRALQALGIAAYTAALTPLVCAGLERLERWIFVVPSSRERR